MICEADGCNIELDTPLVTLTTSDAVTGRETTLVFCSGAHRTSWESDKGFIGLTDNEDEGLLA